MKSIILVFIITICFLVGMTKFTNDTNYNEAVRYAELSEYYNQVGSSNVNQGGGVFLETIDIEITFSGEVKSKKSFKISHVRSPFQSFFGGARRRGFIVTHSAPFAQYVTELCKGAVILKWVYICFL